MDRASLELLLAQGLSLEQIAQRFGRSASTVGYWVKKHGLEAVHRERHTGRGGLGREHLEELLEEGLSVAGIAAHTGFSATAVKYWLRRYGLRTARAVRNEQGRRARREGLAVARMECRTHGLTDFLLEGRGAYRCLMCRQERVAERRRTVKQILVTEAGGSCRICGYSRYYGALHFHHKDPTKKSFALSQLGWTLSLERLRAEARKCVLLCANCHAEVGSGAVTL